MSPPRRPRTAAAPLLLALAPVLCAPALCAAAPRAAAQGGDVFDSGPRWEAAPAPGAPWMPGEVAFAAEGELAWAARDGELALYPTGLVGAAAPALVSAAFASALGPLRLAGGPAPDALFVLAPLPGASPGQRRTLVARFAGTATLAPLWVHDLGSAAPGAPRLAAGAEAIAAAHDTESGSLRLDWVDAADGSLLARFEVDAGPLRALAADADGRRVALVAGDELLVARRAPSGAVLEHRSTLPAPTLALALSADGEVVAVGASPDASVRRADLGWAEAESVAAAPGEVAVRVALDGAGDRLAAAFWDAGDGRAVRCVVRELGPGGGELLTFAQSNGPGGPQNYPAGLRLAADGSRLAVGTWGGGGSEPEALLLDVASGAALLAEDLGGSLLALDLDATGTRLLVAAKDEHAGTLAGAGTVRLLDTGERDLQVVGGATSGGTVHLRATAPGAALGALLVGTPGPPLAVPGVVGALGLDPAAPLLVLGLEALGPDVVGATLRVPPGLVGAPLRLQAWLGPAPGTLTATLLAPVFLP